MKFLILLTLLSVSFADHHHQHSLASHPKITCDGITAKTDTDFKKLEGNWVIVENFGFKDGHPFTPPNDDRPNLCYYGKGYEASDESIKIQVDLYKGDSHLETEQLTTHTIDSANHGRSSLASDKRDRNNWELMILDYDTDKYFIYMLCAPPNENNERLPAYVNILSRHESHSDHEKISADETNKIETHLKDILHLDKTDVKPIRFATSCWKNQ